MKFPEFFKEKFCRNQQQTLPSDFAEKAESLKTETSYILTITSTGDFLTQDTARGATY